MTYDLVSLGKRAQQAAYAMRTCSAIERNNALQHIADAIIKNRHEILEANRLDVETARAKGMRSAMLDRLTLDTERIDGIADAVCELIALPDPVGIIEQGSVRPNGIQILKTKVPFGVIAMIYEARPNVTVDAAALCIKSGNACILRGGSEAYATNRALIKTMREALVNAGLPADAICFVEDTSHDTAIRLMKLSKYIDLLIPRGSARLIASVVENATVPIIETGVGNCHIYVDRDADLAMAVNLTDNGKTQRPSVCNALETLLVHRDVAERFLPMVKERLDAHNVELRGCAETRKILKGITLATEEDYETEFLDYILAVKVVEDIGEAIAHITRYTSGHSECIVTQNLAASQRFSKEVDCAALYVNASTRFTDGNVFGLGAEIGISTQKLHTRGPMGLQELTCVKYIVTGEGQIR